MRPVAKDLIIPHEPWKRILNTTHVRPNLSPAWSSVWGIGDKLQPIAGQLQRAIENIILAKYASK